FAVLLATRGAEPSQSSIGAAARAILEARLARGEIDVQEFRRRSSILSQTGWERTLRLANLADWGLSALSARRSPIDTLKMSYTVQTIPTATPPQPRASRRTTWLLAVGVAAVMAVAVTVGVVVFRGNNSTSTGTAASQQLASAQLISVQQSCEQWAASSTPPAGDGSPSSAWCTTMTDWMGQRLRNKRSTGAMMW